ncbi:MAG: BCD family MFS transporter [Pseudomonadota bacterium]
MERIENASDLGKSALGKSAIERSAAFGLSWLAIVRLGLVQTALGAVVVLCTATINRVMIVELALLALVPAALIGLYHGFQMLRPSWGHGADQRSSRTPWVIGGMAALSLGMVGASVATAWMETSFAAGLALALPSFAVLGLGLGASATNLLAMLAAHVAPERKAAAGSLVWILMIAGLAASGITIGQVLDPYSGARLITISLWVAAIAMVVCVLAIWGVEPKHDDPNARPAPSRKAFLEAAKEIWADATARAFTIFVFVSMLAYNTQDLILEPYGGHVFGMTPGESTALGGSLHAGALLGMILVFIAGLARAAGVSVAGIRLPSTRSFVVVGCVGSGLALLARGLGGLGAGWPIGANVMILGFCNGVFAVAAIGAMMGLASAGPEAREGLRMGVFGAAQSIGFALGASFGAAALDALRATLGVLAPAYATVFIFEGALFLVAARLAWGALSPALDASVQVSPSTRREPTPGAAMIPGE